MYIIRLPFWYINIYMRSFYKQNCLNDFTRFLLISTKMVEVNSFPRQVPLGALVNLIFRLVPTDCDP